MFVGTTSDHLGDKAVTSLCHPFLRGPLLARGLPGVQQLVSAGEQNLAIEPACAFPGRGARSRSQEVPGRLQNHRPLLGTDVQSELSRVFFANANELF